MNVFVCAFLYHVMITNINDDINDNNFTTSTTMQTAAYYIVFFCSLSLSLSLSYTCLTNPLHFFNNVYAAWDVRASYEVIYLHKKNTHLIISVTTS